MLSAEDLRAALARRRDVKLYHVAAVVGLHPNHLSAVLNERVPLTADLARRIERAIVETQPRSR